MTKEQMRLIAQAAAESARKVKFDVYAADGKTLVEVASANEAIGVMLAALDMIARAPDGAAP